MSSKTKRSPLTSLEVAVLIQVAQGLSLDALARSKEWDLQNKMSPEAWEVAKAIEAMRASRQNHEHLAFKRISGRAGAGVVIGPQMEPRKAKRREKSEDKRTAQYFLRMVGAH